MYLTLNLEIRNRVAHLTLNRPDAMNTLSLQMGKDLLQAAIAIEADKGVRAVVLSGAGKAFCAGGDLRGMQEQGEGIGNYVHELTVHLHTAVNLFANMNAPVIAAVNGTTAGAGVGLVAMADLSLAAQSAKFTLAYTGVGLTPDGGTSYFLPRLLGLKRAAELMLLNRVLSADEAQQWGLVNQVIPDADLAAEAAKLAEKLAGGPVGAYGKVKRLLAASVGAMESQMTLEGRTISSQCMSAEGREGISAFLSKRKPNYL